MKWLVRLLVAFVVVVVVAVGVLWVMGHRREAGTTHASVEIAQPPAVVWAWITEPAKLTQWVGWLAAVEDDSTTAPGVGHRTVWVMNDPNMKGPLRLNAVVIAVDSLNSAAAMVELPDAFTGEVDYALTDLGQGRTLLTQTGRFRYSNPFAALMEPLVTPQAQQKGQADFDRLKRLAEAAPAP